MQVEELESAAVASGPACDLVGCFVVGVGVVRVVGGGWVVGEGVGGTGGEVAAAGATGAGGGGEGERGWDCAGGGDVCVWVGGGAGVDGGGYC